MKAKSKLLRMMLLPFRLFYVLYGMVLFVVLMIPVFLWSLAVISMGRIRGGNLVYYGCVAWAHVWFTLMFIRHRNFHLAPRQEERPHIYVANHNSYLDAALIPMIFRHPIRPLAKSELSGMPVFGFIYKNVVVSVDRSSPINRARSIELLKSILGKGISILVFPEGTFNISDKPLKSFYDGAFRVAVETATPVMPVLILDAHERMHHSSVFTLNPGKSRAVFLPEVPVAGYTPERAAELKQKVFSIMEDALRKYRASWIAGNEKVDDELHH